MWNVEKDPWLNPSAASVSIVDGELDIEVVRRWLAAMVAEVPRLRDRVRHGVGRLTAADLGAGPGVRLRLPHPPCRPSRPGHRAAAARSGRPAAPGALRPHPAALAGGRRRRARGRPRGAGDEAAPHDRRRLRDGAAAGPLHGARSRPASTRSRRPRRHRGRDVRAGRGRAGRGGRHPRRAGGPGRHRAGGAVVAPLEPLRTTGHRPRPARKPRLQHAWRSLAWPCRSCARRARRRRRRGGDGSERGRTGREARARRCGPAARPGATSSCSTSPSTTPWSPPRSSAARSTTCSSPPSPTGPWRTTTSAVRRSPPSTPPSW